MRGTDSLKATCLFAAAVAAGFLLGHKQGTSFHSASTAAIAKPIDHPSVAETTPNKSRSLHSEPNSWREIHVFQGKLQTPKPAKEWYSQANQDEIVFGLLRQKTQGYFLDLAANDATIFSNTFALEQKFFWKGLCVEPNTIYWPKLLSHRSCTIVGAVVGNSTMDQVPFRFQAHPGTEGIIGFRNPAKYLKNAEMVYTVSLLDIFERFDVPHQLDYLSLDVEGAEEFVMKVFPLSEYRISVMTIEEPSTGLKEQLEAHGYQMLATLGNFGETLWAHKSVRSDLDLSVLSKYEGVQIVT